MTAYGKLDDTEVDSLKLEWSAASGSFLVRARAPDDSSFALHILENMITVFSLDDLCLLAGGVLAGGTRATDAGGYALDGDTAIVWDAGENKVRVTRAAMTRLISRLLDMALDHADLGGDQNTERWAMVDELAAAVRRRLSDR